MKQAKENTRYTKTGKVLNDALCTLLARQNFSRITVSNLCEEAQVSRATFYAHYDDKYDLLRCWLHQLMPNHIKMGALGEPYERAEAVVNAFFEKKRDIVRNILNGADEETLMIVFETLLSMIGITEAMAASEKLSQPYVVFSNFYAGGLIYYLLWQVKNRFPPEVPPMNESLHKVMEGLRRWGMDTVEKGR